MMKRLTKNATKRMMHSAFILSQRLGINILPLHFYSSIPNMRDLSARSDWKEPRSMHGISMQSIPDQLALVSEYLSMINPNERRNLYNDAVRLNGSEGYGIIESDVLAGMIIARRPKRIIQIGCGVSTAIVLSAADLAQYEPAITCVDPYPTKYLTTLASERRITLFPVAAQVLGLEAFSTLQKGDLLFIDSTHTVKIGSEVNRIVLEVLPRLPLGVLVHFHDIYLPYEYSRDFLSRDLFFPGETSLLYAYLLENRNFRIDLSMSVLHYAAPTELKRLIPKYDPQGNDAGLRSSGGCHFPSSIFLSRFG
jgi:hypothetical protein